MKTNTLANFQKSRAGATPRRTHKPSGLIEIVGEKTHEQLSSAWIEDFHKNSPVSGRPAGGLTVEEMVNQAGSSRFLVEKYIKNNPKKFTRVVGTMTYESGNRRKTYYVFNG